MSKKIEPKPPCEFTPLSDIETEGRKEGLRKYAGSLQWAIQKRVEDLSSENWIHFTI